MNDHILKELVNGMKLRVIRVQACDKRAERRL